MTSGRKSLPDKSAFSRSGFKSSSKECARLSIEDNPRAAASPFTECTCRNRVSSFLRNALSSRAGSRSTALIIFMAALESFKKEVSCVGIDVQNSQQRIDLRLRLRLRGLQFAREIHAGGDIRHGNQHVGDLAVHAHAVEFELQIARREFALTRVEVHFDLAQRIDAS